MLDPATDHIAGRANAPVTAIVYSDYQCPFCRKHHANMLLLARKNRSTLRWTLRNFPLPFHPNAQPAAAAAECAEAIGGVNKFWRFADAIFKREKDNFDFLSIARSLGIPLSSFQTCINDNRYAQRVQLQHDKGAAAGVSGTPTTVFYNRSTGRSLTVVGAQAQSDLQSALDKMLAK